MSKPLTNYSGEIENGQATWLKSLTQSRDSIDNLLTPDEKTAIVLIVCRVILLCMVYSYVDNCPFIIVFEYTQMIKNRPASSRTAFSEGGGEGFSGANPEGL